MRDGLGEGLSLDGAVAAALLEVRLYRGRAGIVAVTPDGALSIAMTKAAMPRGVAWPSGVHQIDIDAAP